ncbi:YtxH domain-containing protein [Cohnella nanjingensis]|uniref:YtxH domain-containing protein n=1 Tax=Cohnella nanjingensis TaxID=1387779 RepID=A0A7X0RRX6_9BACL|nr:YtxH domain-containing protein [Cohnella nanjingensis]MBB6672558.1 YtxH domain-containing protein [Cohnella nanjingensis]
MAGLIKGALIGGVVGAAAALLLAPKSGRELRQDLKTTYNKSMDRTKQWVSDAGVKTQEVAQKVGRQATDLIGQTKSAVQTAKDGIQSAKDGMHDAMSDAQKPN